MLVPLWSDISRFHKGLPELRGQMCKNRARSDCPFNLWIRKQFRQSGARWSVKKLIFWWRSVKKLATAGRGSTDEGRRMGDRDRGVGVLRGDTQRQLEAGRWRGLQRRVMRPQRRAGPPLGSGLSPEKVVDCERASRLFWLLLGRAAEQAGRCVRKMTHRCGGVL